MRQLSLPATLLLGILLLLPTATLGFYADDHVHQLVLRGDEEVGPMRPWSLYDFGEKADWDNLAGGVGTFPWWTDADWKARFFRPVSSLYLAVQHAMWGEWAPGYHLVGLLLFGVLLFSIHELYRTLGLSEQAARLGTLLFAVLDSVVLPVGWLANHNSLLAAVFSVLSFKLLVRGSARSGRLALGLLLAVAAAGSMEAGSVALALATLVLLRRSCDAVEAQPRRLRIAGVCALLLSIGYAALLIRGGYGTRSVFYATPWEAPGRFAGNLLVLVTAGPLSLLGPFPLDVAGLFPALRLPLILLGCLVGIPIWTWIARTVCRQPGAGWLAVWSLAFLVVHAGTLPADRLLFLPAVGGLGLLALFFEAYAERPLRRTRLLFVSVVIGSGLSLLVQGLGLSAGSAYLRESAPATDVGAPELGHRDVFLLQAESQFQAFTLPGMWAFLSPDRDLSISTLQSGNRAVRWTRLDETSFEFETLGEPFLTGPFEAVYLSHPPDFDVGDAWETPAFRVEALAVDGGRPTRLRFEMRRGLDEEGVRFLRPEGGKLVRVLPPRIGESVDLAVPERVGPYMP